MNIKAKLRKMIFCSRSQAKYDELVVQKHRVYSVNFLWLAKRKTRTYVLLCRFAIWLLQKVILHHRSLLLSERDAVIEDMTKDKSKMSANTPPSFQGIMQGMSLWDSTDTFLLLSLSTSAAMARGLQPPCLLGNILMKRRRTSSATTKLFVIGWESSTGIYSCLSWEHCNQSLKTSWLFSYSLTLKLPPWKSRALRKCKRFLNP